MKGSVQVSVGLAGHKRIDFDKRAIKRTLRSEAGQIRKLARRLVSRRAASAPNEMPGRQSGALMRSIRVKVSSGGFWAKIAPYMTSEMQEFYPAFLFYGVKSQGRIKRLEPGQGIGPTNRRRRGERAKLEAERRASSSYRLRPRDNYMVSALDTRRGAAQAAILSALKGSLKPR